MNTIRVIILCLVCVVLAVATDKPIEIKAPGATGMKSNPDRTDLRATDAALLLNADITTYPGLVRKRSGHVKYGTNAQATKAIHALYDPLTKWKCAIGIVPIAEVVGHGYMTTADSTQTYDTVTVDSAIGIFAHTANYGAVLNDTIPNWWVQYDTDHDFTVSDLGLVHCAGGSPPALLSLRAPAQTADSIVDSIYVYELDSIFDTTIGPTYWCDGPPFKKNCRDTTVTITVYPIDSVTLIKGYTIVTDSVTFDPTVTPLSPEAPGVLRPFAINDVSGNLDGVYQYSTTFKYSDSTVHSARAPSSIILKVSSGKIILTSFPRLISKRFVTIGDTLTLAVIWRRRVDIVDAWRPIDSIMYHVDSPVVYVDNVTTGGTVPTTANYDYQQVNDPGQPWEWSLLCDSDTLNTWKRNSDYWIGCSYIDTVLGVESPIGWFDKIQSLDTTTAGDACRLALRQSYSGGHRGIRIYRTVVNTSVLGASDSSVMYALDDYDLLLDQGIQVVTVGSMHDTILGDVGGILDENGVTLIRPTYIQGMAATFIDMEEMAGRMWGVGDPEFPSRLYYSKYDESYNWGVTDYLDLDESDNDIIIAIERIQTGSGDALIVFKRRKIFGVFGYDPEYDLSLHLLADGCGAISKELVIKQDDFIYFVNNSLDVCRVRGTTIDTISRGVRDEVIGAITETP